MKSILNLTLLICISVAMSACTKDIGTYEKFEYTPREAPLDVKFLRRRSGPSEFRNYHFEITLQNPTKRPRWYILQHNANIPLRDDEVFKNPTTKLMPFVSHLLYDGTNAKGKAVRVLFNGKDKFIGYYLLPKAKVTIKNHVVIAKTDFNHLEVWEADAYVNGETHLSEWLPYNVLSDPEVIVPEDGKERRLDLNPRGTHQRKDYPKEEVYNVTIEPNKKWKVPVDF